MRIDKSRSAPLHDQGGRRPERAAARRRLLLAAVLAVGFAAMPRAALAYTDAEIAAYVKRRLSCSGAFPEKTQAGQLRGMPGPVQAFRFLTESCPSLVFPGASFAVVAPGPGGMALLLPKPTPFAIESLAIADGYVVATSLDLAPGDPRCCPTRRTRQRWAVSGSGLVPAP